MTRTKKMVGILGVGNLLMRDEGFGVHFIEYLNARYQTPDRVKILDGGTAGIMLSTFLEEVDHLYVIDTVALAGPAGAIHQFTADDLRARTISSRLSPHQVGLLEILELCRLRDKAPAQIELLTVVPAEVALGVGLSPTLSAKLPEVFTLLASSLAQHDIFLTPV